MKIIKKDGQQERRIVTAMIVDSTALGQIAAIWSKDCVRSKWCGIIGSWCVKFYEKYHRAPGKAIEGLFQSWADSKKQGQDTVKLIEQFLVGLSDDYSSRKKESNSDYIVDMAANYFNEARAKKFIELVDADITNGEMDKAMERIAKFNKVEIGTGAGIDILRDKKAMKRAFEAKSEPLIKYPGDLGVFFGDSLERDAFIALQGAEKRKKTWWLIDIAWRAMIQRRKVAFFEVGDLSEAQIMRRFMVRAARKPLYATKVQYPQAITSTNEGVSVDFVEKEYTSDLTWKMGYEACEKIITRDIRSDESNFQLFCHPNDSISMLGIEATLGRLEKKGWVPDVVVIDYADILAPMNGLDEGRDSVNRTWKRMRGISQSLHCLLLTATQAKATSYNAKTLDMSHFSEDKRKYAHVTGMIGLNSTPEEKALQITRLNWLVLRESNFEEGRCVHVAGCVPIGNLAVRSSF